MDYHKLVAYSNTHLLSPSVSGSEIQVQSWVQCQGESEFPLGCIPFWHADPFQAQVVVGRIPPFATAGLRLLLSHWLGATARL